MPFNKPHIAFTTENPSEDGKFVTTKRPATRDEMHGFLASKGFKVHKTTGHYGDKPEKSIFVEEPTSEQRKTIHHIAKIHGQDSVIDYVNGKPHVVYVNGEHEGKARPPIAETISGEQVKTDTPHTEFEEAPHKGVKFSHQYDWDNDSNLVPADSMKKSELNKGQNGDWQKEGYTIHHEPWEELDPKDIRVYANDKTGKRVAYANILHYPKVIEADYTDVHPEHQRKGLASALYSHAEKTMGKPLQPAEAQTVHGQKLWSQPNRPFGKSEDLNKANPSDNTKAWADEYAQKKGIKLNHNIPNVQINPEHGAKIATGYHQMVHEPNNPNVKSAYSALANETGEQFKHLIGKGLKISKMKVGQENPYKTSKDLFQDLSTNNHMWYYPTEQGYGSNEQGSDHPMLQPSKFRHDGKVMPHNDVFRVVHDVFGHHMYGNGFGPKGEHQAYLAHKQMFSPEAQKALASETMGQNNWVNWGEHGATNRANPAQTKYAEQKAGLLPNEIMNGNWHNGEVKKSIDFNFFISETPLSKNLIHHVYKSQNGTDIHELNHSAYGLIGTMRVKNGLLPSVELAAIHPRFRNQGFGEQLHKAAAEHYGFEKLQKVDDEPMDMDFGSDAVDPKAITVHGNPVSPNASIKTGTKSSFDPEKGVLSTPKGNFNMYMPKHTDRQYQNILNSPDVKDTHERAMKHWMHLNQLHRQGHKIPAQIGAHANIFSIMSANNPVPSQELSYSRLMDTLKQKGITPGTKEFAEGMKEGGAAREHFLNSHSATEFPEHSNEYWTGRARPAITQGEDSELTGRKAGEIIRPGFNEAWADRLSHYDPEAHQYFTDLYNKHGADTQALVSEAMGHKSAPDKVIPKGHPMKRGIGLASKTLRYAANMAGGGNAVIPDTHFIRHTFGLDANKDVGTIKHLKQILLNPKNHHLLNGIDKAYLNHPAARHVQKKYFNGEKDPNSIFPAFWQHWLSIPHHEKAMGIGNSATARNNTDHTPYWESAQKILAQHGLDHGMHKSEKHVEPLAVRTARAVHEMTDKLGAAPASMVYFAHLVPQLLEHGKKLDFKKTPKHKLAESLARGLMKKPSKPFDPNNF